MKMRIVVVEDHAALRHGIVDTIDREVDLMVCGQADDVSSALDVVSAARPDLVLIDLQLRSSSGIDLIGQLRQRHPALLTVAMTMFDQESFEKLARAAGAAGFVSKQEGPARLLATIRAALDVGRASQANRHSSSQNQPPAKAKS